MTSFLQLSFKKLNKKLNKRRKTSFLQQKEPFIDTYEHTSTQKKTKNGTINLNEAIKNVLTVQTTTSVNNKKPDQDKNPKPTSPKKDEKSKPEEKASSFSLADALKSIQTLANNPSENKTKPENSEKKECEED